MTEPTLVDAHHHFWDLSVRDQGWITQDLAAIRRSYGIEDLRPEARAAGVAATVLVQTVTVAEETPELLALAHGSDLVAGVVGWTDLTAPDTADRLGALRALPGGDKLVGIRHQIQEEPDPEWVLRPDVLRGLAAVRDAGLAYDLIVLDHQLPAATEAARRLPGLTFVLDHLGKPPIASGTTEPWAARLRALAALPNTVCKLSGMVTEASWDSWTAQDLRPYADTAIEAFGPGRLMFGSDWPVCTLAASYGQVLDTALALLGGLGEGERDAVLGATARRAYGLGSPRAAG
jgi:L-fuconolactonase